MERFVGRVREKAQLEAVIEQPRPTIAVVYGRRRVGKSELIRQSTMGRNVLKFEGLEGQPKQKQIRNFLFQLGEQADIDSSRIRDWPEALILLRELTREGQWVLVFDEFQWMANYQNELISVIKMIWEQYLAENPEMTLVLCGSIASFMKSEVLKSSALYGRAGYELNRRLDDLASAGFLHPLVPFDKPETSKLLKYILIDPYVRSYTAMIQGAPRQAAPPGTQFRTLLASPRYHSWLGRSSEHVCMQHHREISRILGFEGVPYRVGPFFQRRTLHTPGVQIDLLFERSDKVFVLCEMKYQSAAVQGDVIDQVSRKVAALQRKYRDRTILKVLLTKSDPTEAVQNSGFFFRTIKAEELLARPA